MKPESIKPIVAQVFCVQQSALTRRGKRRSQKNAWARFSAMAVLRDQFHMKYREIGQIFHCDPTSVRYGYIQTMDRVGVDPAFAEKIKILLRKVAQTRKTHEES